MQDNPLITAIECRAMRGVAIFGIIMHNFSHWLPGIAEENEFQFFTERASVFNHILTNPDSVYPLHVFSYFGHYGVPVFLFLSAYGLVIKYENTKADCRSNIEYIRCHYIKLFKMMIIGYVIYLIGDYWRGNVFNIGNIITQLVMIINILPDPGTRIDPGPYWFFGLMLQFYILYRIVLSKSRWMVPVLLTAVCILVMMFCHPSGYALDYLKYNFIGNILPFCAGLLCARYVKKVPRRVFMWGFLPSVILLWLYGNEYITWFLCPLMAIAATICFIKLCHGLIVRLFGLIGSVSAALFVIHPILRREFAYISQRGEIYWGLTQYLVTTAAAAVILWLVWKYLPGFKTANRAK